VEIPTDLKPVLELAREGNSEHIRCKYREANGKECGVLFFTIEDAIHHLATHDERYRRLARRNA